MSDVFLRRLAPVLAGLALLAAAACDPVPEETSPAAVPAAAAASGSPISRAGTKLAQFQRDAHGVRDAGDFVVRYEATENADYQELEGIFKETRLLEDTVHELNGVFALPSDVPVVLRECGEVNAFYDPETREISLCYELIEHFSEIFMADVQTDEEAEEAGTAVAGATMFTFFHEMGHALIDLYDLPVTGREEDAVDQLATMILLQGGDEGETAALDGANSFVSEEESELDDLTFWDEHSLDEQRFYNVVCWSYGNNPEGLQSLVDDETLPADRAERCPAEYARMSRSWDKLLDPYVKG
jgi:hypothetical protein